MVRMAAALLLELRLSQHAEARDQAKLEIWQQLGRAQLCYTAAAVYASQFSPKVLLWEQLGPAT